MVASTITIVPVYLNCMPGERLAIAGGVSELEDDTAVHVSDSRTVFATERSERALQSWQLSWNDVEAPDAQFIWDLFRLCRNSKGFLFISPKEEDRVATAQPIRNTVTGLNTGNGSATTFQLQFGLSLAYDIGGGSVSIDTFDVNYPLEDTVIVKVNGTPAAVSSVNLLTGVVTMSVAPANGALMTADYERAIAVHFTSQSLARTLQEWVHSEVRSVQIKEIL